MLKFKERKSRRKDWLENLIHSFSKTRLQLIYQKKKQSMTNSVRLFTLKLTLPLTLTNQLLPIMYVNNIDVVLNVKYKEN